MLDDEARAPPEPPQPPSASEGKDLGRLLALTDGVFAFAMTLLVLGLAIPGSGVSDSALPRFLWDELAKPGGPFQAYLLGFFVIAAFWVSHHRVFSYVARWTSTLIRLNLVLLLFVALMPFFVQILDQARAGRNAVIVFAAVWATAGAILHLIWRHAAAHWLTVPRLRTSWDTYIRERTLISPVVLAASIPVAFLSPPAAEYSWALIAFALIRRRKRAAATPEAPPA